MEIGRIELHIDDDVDTKPVELKRWFRIDRWSNHVKEHEGTKSISRKASKATHMPLRVQVWTPGFKDNDVEIVWTVCREFLPIIFGVPIKDVGANDNAYVCLHMGEFED